MRLTAVGPALALTVACTGCTAGGDGLGGTALGWRSERIDVDGVSISVSCTAARDRTVVLVSGIGEDGGASWGRSKVPAGVAPDARVCIYDRPGLGASGPASTPRTVANNAAELDALVQRGPFPSPVVLVAQGAGTFIVRVYARDHLRDVAGIVLVDPPFEVVNAKPPEGASDGEVADYALAADVNGNLGDYGPGGMAAPPVPTVVLSAGNHPVLPPDLGGGTPSPTPSVTLPTKMKVEQRQSSQQNLARKAPFGSSRVIDGAGSYIQYWDPVAVIDAIRSVVADPRGNTPPTSPGGGSTAAGG